MESKPRVDKLGNMFWELPNGKLHREDGPAIEFANGDKSWLLNDELHREDGPAFEGADGSIQWWVNGLVHREDGPAVEYPDDRAESWYLWDRFLTDDQIAILQDESLDLDTRLGILRAELGIDDEV